MLTDFQTRKFSNEFHLLDTDKKGYLTKADFDRVARKVVALRDWLNDSPAAIGIYAMYQHAWNRFAEKADTDKDGRITLEDWLNLSRAAVESAGTAEFNEILAQQTEFVFHTFDLNSDGVLTLEEYEKVCHVYSIDPAKYAQAIPRIDFNGTGRFSKEDLHRLLREYYVSTNPEDPGNWIYGLF